MNKTAVEWLVECIHSTEYQMAFGINYISPVLMDKALAIEKDQLCALYLTLLLNTPDITQFDFEEWYKQNTTHE